MATVGNQSGYQFTEAQRSSVRDALERLHRTTGVTVTGTFGTSVGFDAIKLGVEDGVLGVNADLVVLQSVQDASGRIWFGLLSFDNEQVGPQAAYDTFQEALVYADVFARSTIDGLKGLKAKQSSSRTGNVIDSQVLCPDEVQLVQAFANGMGLAAGLAGFAKFMESGIGVLSIALGVMDKDQPIMLGTVVAAKEGAGGYSCSVRGFDNSAVPGSEYYSSVTAALVATRPYFEHMAKMAAKHVRPSLFGRIRGAFGL